MKRILLLTVGILAACLFGVASARDLDGRYADSPLREWFDHLASGKKDDTPEIAEGFMPSSA